MRWFERLRRWERAMEDIEDSRGIELRQLRDRVRGLKARFPVEPLVPETNAQ